MSSRHKEIETVVGTGDRALARRGCEPRIAPWSANQALDAVNQEIRKAIVAITGKEPDGVTRSNRL